VDSAEEVQVKGGREVLLTPDRSGTRLVEQVNRDRRNELPAAPGALLALRLSVFYA
jgi:hypothetical protein